MTTNRDIVDGDSIQDDINSDPMTPNSNPNNGHPSSQLPPLFRRDELYNQLKVWQDTNQDGISRASELKTLSQAGVNNIFPIKSMVQSNHHPKAA